ncbi:EAL domain-containing protein [Sterolibacterium denitrificans]|nr:EAL domain-containing protein [Sterolibacterium denitrificans]
MQSFRRLLRRTAIRHQLAAVVGTAVAVIAIVSSLAISWQTSRQISRHQIEQGRQVAENLARQSRLALLYDASDNASDVAALTLAFPDVVSLAIHRDDGSVLLSKNNASDASSIDDDRARPIPARSYLARETDDAWYFVAPVKIGSEEASPFSVSEPSQQALGYVSVVKSKATLRRMQAEVFAVNFSVSFIIALIVLAILRSLAQRMTRPLLRLSDVMAQAEAGTRGLRADTAGPKDIADMSIAFNKMMRVLEERETELRTARDNALKFAQLKADFAATVSHEIRTPLNGVVGTLDILMAADLPPKQHQFVEIAWDSSQYLLDLINNILDFSRLEADKVALEKTDFGLVHLVEGVLELLTPQAAQKKLDLGYLIAAEVPARMLGDPRRLRQILINLIGNAIKFTQQGSVSVRVSKAADGGGPVDGETVLSFEVIDTGIGISSEAQANIFDSFTQEDTSTTRRFGGSGLGLAISRQLVELMGGSIGVDSAPGQGSRFWFSIPMGTTVSTMSTMGAHPAMEDGTAEQPRWSGVRALIIEESELARRFLQQTLSAWGLECKASSDANAALSELHAAEQAGRPYQLLILDTTFATGDGSSLPLRIQSELQRPPRLILMNRFGADYVPAAVHADGYVAKPLRVERLLETLRGVLGDCGAISPAPAPAGPILLPLPAERKRVAADVREAAQPAGAEAGLECECEILVIEDNRTNQAIIQGLLEVLGCKAEIAEDGQQGLRAFKRRDWSLILMDCCMPEMDGYEVTAAIRDIERNSGKHVPVVAMTANVSPGDIEKCLAAGMDDHLAKPLNLESLSDKLQRWIPRYVPVRATPRPEARLHAHANREAEPETATIDSDKLAKLREQLGSAFGQAIRPFLEDMPVYFERMAQAIERDDAGALHRAAHAVKGAAGNLGCDGLAELAREMEDGAAALAVADLLEMLARARLEYGLVKQVLLGELQTLPLLPAEDSSKGALVLIVDDDRSTRATLRYALQRSGFSVEEAADGQRALALLDRSIPDVILMDAMMPVMDGFATCTRLQDHPRGKNIPVLMITALEDTQSIERAFAVGASDYIPKPLNLAVVSQRIKRVVEAQRAEKHVRHLVFNDSLTGLPNRVQFADYLHRAIEHARGTQQLLAVLFLDLDRFKFVNDTLGHEVGDRLIKAVAGRIRNCVRASDCVARLGGDEFAVLLDELDDPASALNAAQKIRRSLTSAFEIDGQDIFVSTSVGIALYPADGADVSTLLRRADTAMFSAKRSNTGVEFYKADMEASVSEQLHLDSSLRRALERMEFEVYYQPKADARSGQIIGMEALVRWMHPDRGMISPLEFIPLAEENGLISAIGETVLRTACGQTRRWLDAGVPSLNVAVNLSGVQLQEKGLSELIESILEETGLDPCYLTLEITESMLMEHSGEIVDTLTRLKRIGLRMDIDDFGTGYSSLAYLKRFPVDALKVDRAFISDMATNQDDAAIVSGIVALAHSLRLKVVAEGVETSEQFNLLRQIGCDSVQGYYHSQPLPAHEFEQQILVPNFPGFASALQAG